jgi:hypothetical protein
LIVLLRLRLLDRLAITTASWDAALLEVLLRPSPLVAPLPAGGPAAVSRLPAAAAAPAKLPGSATADVRWRLLLAGAPAVLRRGVVRRRPALSTEDG